MEKRVGQERSLLITTIEEANVGDSGRVQDVVQGRHLITPDELISLDKEVIVFTADTKPLKLPLTDPLAYEQALAYDAPVRARHQVSEFVKKRGRSKAASEKSSEIPQEQWQPAQTVAEAPAKPVVSAPSKSDRQRIQPKVDNKAKEESDSKPYPKRSGGAPDYDL